MPFDEAAWMAASILYALGGAQRHRGHRGKRCARPWLSILDTEAWGQTSIRAYKLGLAPVEDHLIFTLDGPPARGFDHSTFALEDPAAAVKRLKCLVRGGHQRLRGRRAGRPAVACSRGGGRGRQGRRDRGPFPTELIKADDGDDSSDLAGTPPSEAVLWMRHKEAEVLPSPGSPPLNMKDTALSTSGDLSSIRCSQLNTRKRDALLAARNLLLTRMHKPLLMSRRLRRTALRVQRGG